MNKKDPMSGHDLIVIGALAGGVEALPQLVGSRPKNLPAFVLVVLHVSSHGPGYLPHPIKRHAPCPSRMPSMARRYVRGTSP